jgi:apolipoprotein N-acyltransferase
MWALAVVTGGVLYALALPPFDRAAFAWLALVPLLSAIRRESTASAFRYGVLSGYASGWAVTWCFADAAARYFELPFPVAVAAVSVWYLVVCGLPFGCFAAGSAVLIRTRSVGESLFLVPALWVATEWLRGYVMGQPWGLLGYTQYAQRDLIQIATLTGVYGVSYLVALGNALVAALLVHREVGVARWAVASAVATVIVCYVGGALSVPGAEMQGAGPAHEVAIVQTNVAPTLRWTRAYTDAQVGAHVRASDDPAVAGASLIVWPENSVPRYLEREPMLAVALARLASQHRADLLFGGPRYDDGRTYNSARLITATGLNGGHYDKRRLVLFAEEKPLTFAERGEPSDSPEEFSAGLGSGVLESFVPIGVSICHEIVHPDLTRTSVRTGAELLVNIANDGWLDGGYQFAGRQHLAMAVFRAVESRRFLVRAATTGTSAVIDPYGNIVAAQPPDTAGIVTATVTGRRALTPYMRAGDLFAVGCILVVLGCLPWQLPIVQRRAHSEPATAAS